MTLTDSQVKHDTDSSFKQPHIDEQTILALYDTLSSLIYSPSSYPPDADGYRDTLSDYFASRLDHAAYSSILPYTRARLLHSTRQDRHRAGFTSSVEDCAYRLSTILESPSMELPRCPLDFSIELTRTPAREGGAQRMGWSSAEDLPLPASDDMRPIDISNMRAFIDDLRADRELVESSPSSENIHGSSIEPDYSSDTLTSAPSEVGCASPTSSKTRKVKLLRRVLQVFRRS